MIDCYFTQLIERLPARVMSARRQLRKAELIHGRMNSVVFTGMSGAAIGFSLAAATPGLRPIVIRKVCDDSHAGNDVFDSVDFGTNFFVVDDLISSGMTMTYIADKLDKFMCPMPKFILLCNKFSANYKRTHFIMKDREVPIYYYD